MTSLAYDLFSFRTQDTVLSEKSLPGRGDHACSLLVTLCFDTHLVGSAIESDVFWGRIVQAPSLYVNLVEYAGTYLTQPGLTMC